MFKPFYGDCAHPDHVGDNQVLIAVKKGWCIYCNQKEKDDKKRKSGKKVYAGIVKKHNPTGEKHLFEHILDSFDDKSEVRCFVCNERISLITPANFAHVLSKGSTPELRLNPENIKVLCFKIDGTGCHSDWDTKPHSELTGPGWEKMKELKQYLKEKANKSC